MVKRFRIALPLLFLVTLTLVAAPAQAALWVFDVIVDGSQEVPSVATPGSGTASVALTPFWRHLIIRDIDAWWGDKSEFSNLSGTVTAAHIHGPAAVGSNGPVITPLEIDLGVSSGSFTTPFVPTQPNSPYGFQLTPQQYQDALNGLLYINIHTTAFPDGEIRGQLINPRSVPEPLSATLLAAGSLGLLYRRRR